MSCVWPSHYFNGLKFLNESWTIGRRAKPKTNDVDWFLVPVLAISRAYSKDRSWLQVFVERLFTVFVGFFKSLLQHTMQDLFFPDQKCSLSIFIAQFCVFQLQIWIITKSFFLFFVCFVSLFSQELCLMSAKFPFFCENFKL